MLPRLFSHLVVDCHNKLRAFTAAGDFPIENLIGCVRGIDLKQLCQVQALAAAVLGCGRDGHSSGLDAGYQTVLVHGGNLLVGGRPGNVL